MSAEQRESTTSPRHFSCDRTDNVFLFVPNLIGYGRALLLLAAMMCMQHCPVTASCCYALSGLLDAVDGYAARVLRQSSKMGAMLDQLVDRGATLCLTACLCTFYPHALFWLQASMLVDVTCHWIHVHVASMRGADSHKSVHVHNWRLLQLYYTSRPLLFSLCCANELFYSSLYLLHFSEGPSLPLPLLSVGLFRVLAWLTLPLAVLKSVMAVMQGVSAWYSLGLIDIEERRAVKQH